MADEEVVHGPLPYRRAVWVAFHWLFMISVALNILLVIQLERAKDVQEELLKDHEKTIKKQQQWLDQMNRQKEDWP